MTAALLAVERQTGIVLVALAALSVAAAVVAFGAWRLLRRDARRARDPRGAGEGDATDPGRNLRT